MAVYSLLWRALLIWGVEGDVEKKKKFQKKGRKKLGTYSMKSTPEPPLGLVVKHNHLGRAQSKVL